MNVQYEHQGDYLIPCIRTKEQKEIHLGAWANRHRQYLKQSHKVRYYNLLTSEKLYDYLADIEYPEFLSQRRLLMAQIVKKAYKELDK